MANAIDTAEAYIRHQSDKLVLKNARFVWIMHLLTAALMGYLLIRHAPHPSWLIAAWMVWMTLLGLAQGVVAFRGRTASDSAGPGMLAFDLVALALAAGYGFLAFALVPTGDANLDQFVGFIITGGVLTGTGSYNLRFRTLATSTTLIMVLLAARSYLDNLDGRGLIMAGMLMIFLGLMLMLGLFLRNTSRRGFRLQWEKMRLADQLAAQAEELKLARAEADAANEAKSRFLAQASHDLRQPLHSMGLFLASLRHEKLSARADDIVDRLSQSVDVLSELFSSLLDVTLMDTQEVEVKPRSLKVSALLNDVVSEFEPSSPDHEFCVHADTHLNVVADPLILRRLIQNLVSNAVRHTRNGLITLNAERNDKGAWLSVTDSGPGIPKEDQERIFIEFERGLPVGNATRGLGLGLSIVRRLTRLSDLEISILSEPGQGACFKIGPLLITDDDPIVAPAENVSPKESRPGQRVLIIDDDQPTLEATAAVLSRWGWEIDARQALTADDVQTLTPPDLVISDYDLGQGVTGVEMIEMLRRRLGDIPALIISGSSTERTRNQVREAGYMLLHKPVRPVQLRSALIALMG